MSLSQPLRNFIAAHVDSIETLEILLLLQRTPETYWRAEAIESHLGLNPHVSGSRLQGLIGSGLVTQGATGGYRYKVADDELRALVTELASAYGQRRSTVVNTVFSENLARLRAFADAFKLRDNG